MLLGTVNYLTTTISQVNNSQTSYTVLTTNFSSLTTSTSTLATTLTTNTVPSVLPTAGAGCSGQDIFLPVALGAIPSNIAARGDHPVPRVGITDTAGPIQTNKFYANFFLGSQGSSTFTHPYSLSWSKGSGNAMSWGMSISHIDNDQKVDGPVNPNITGSPVDYYINPIGIQSIILSASELGSSTVISSDTLLAFSANINLAPSNGSSSKITFPLTQGMGFVTVLYTDLQPAIQSSVFFNTVTSAVSPQTGVFKYRITLDDGTFWLLYATPADGVDPNLQVQSSTLLQGLPGFSGTIQVAKNPGNASEAIYDSAAGVYATGAAISGCANGSDGSYSFMWSTGGTPSVSNSSLLMFALPHHIQSMDASTTSKVTTLQLNTTTKGVATAVLADLWTLEEPALPTSMGYAPWRPTT